MKKLIQACVRVACRLAPLSVVGLMVAPWATSRALAEGGAKIADLAGEWRISYGDSFIRVYTIDKDGKMRGNYDDEKWINGYKLTGQIERRDGMLLLNHKEEDTLERLTLGADGKLKIEHFHPKSDFPNKVWGVGTGVRRKATPLAWDAAPDVTIRNLAGQWAIAYSNGCIRLYTIDSDGKLRGRANDAQLTGQIEQRDGRLLLTFKPARSLPSLRRHRVAVDSARTAAEGRAPAIVEWPDHGRSRGDAHGRVDAGALYIHALLLSLRRSTRQRAYESRVVGRLVQLQLCHAVPQRCDQYRLLF